MTRSPLKVNVEQVHSLTVKAVKKSFERLGPTKRWQDCKNVVVVEEAK